MWIIPTNAGAIQRHPAFPAPFDFLQVDTVSIHRGVYPLPWRKETTCPTAVTTGFLDFPIVILH